jgi:hypothetical protein
LTKSNQIKSLYVWISKKKKKQQFSLIILTDNIKSSLCFFADFIKVFGFLIFSILSISDTQEN